MTTPAPTHPVADPTDPSTHPARNIAILMVSARRDGGAETLIRTLVDELADSHYEFEIFTMRRVRDEHALDIHERTVLLHQYPARRLFDPRRFRRLLRALRAGNFDVIHTHLPPATILGSLMGLILRVPVVATLHNSTTKADDHWYQGRLETFLLKHRVQRIIAVGQRTAASRRQMLGDDVELHVLDNAVAPTPPIAPDHRALLRAQIMTDPSRPLLLAVGRLTAQKAHDELLQAVAKVLADGVDCELAIAGRGTREDDLRGVIDELGLGGHAHLLGSRTDVRDVMQASDMFVMSSHWEGLPVALLEAMEAGLPIVSTAVGDVPTVLDGGSGRLVPPRDIDALAAAIVATLVDDDEIGVATNRRLIEDSFSSHAWARAVAEHYEAVIGH
jgi:glycosyltransferase involved in cell wall biosynthesis